MQPTALTTLLVAYFSRRRDVVAAYLFGSSAKGKATEKSDLDIAVLLAKNIGRKRYGAIALEITCDLIQRLRRDDVDVLILNSAGPIAKHQVYHTGKRLFCPHRREALRHQDLASLEYLDFLPFRLLAEQRLLHPMKDRGRHG